MTNNLLGKGEIIGSEVNFRHELVFVFLVLASKASHVLRHLQYKQNKLPHHLSKLISFI